MRNFFDEVFAVVGFAALVLLGAAGVAAFLAVVLVIAVVYMPVLLVATVAGKRVVSVKLHKPDPRPVNVNEIEPDDL